MSKTKSIWNQGDKLLLNENFNERNLARLFFLFSNLALNRFTWENLPDGLESRHIEKALFEYGQCAFYDDESVGLICLPCVSSNNLNVYGDPTNIVLQGINYSKNVKVKDCVRILNNDTCVPTKHHVNYYVKKIYEVDKAMDKNLKKLKIPYIVATTKQNELTMKNLMKKINNDKELCGYNLIVSSELELSNNDIYKIYHNLWRIEESFRIMKSELDARPVFLQKKNTIYGHFLICYLATFLIRILQIFELGDNDSYQEIFNFIRDFKFINSKNKYINIATKSEFIESLILKTNLPLNNSILSKKQLNTILNYNF